MSDSVLSKESKDTIRKLIQMRQTGIDYTQTNPAKTQLWWDRMALWVKAMDDITEEEISVLESLL